MRAVRIAFLSILLGLVPVVAQAAGWAKTYGGRGAEQIPVFAQKPDGGLVAASSGPISTGKFDSWAVSLSPDGDILWQKRYERATNQGRISDIRRTRDGGYVFTGVTTGSAGDVMLVKLGASGNIEWQRMYEAFSDDTSRSVTPTSDGGYAITGTSSFDFLIYGFLIKTDGNGNIQWQKTYDQESRGLFNSLHETPDGGFILAGGGNPLVVVVKLDREGNILWQKGFTNWIEDAWVIKPTTDGGYIVTGSAGSRETIEDWAFAMKLDGSGNIQWQRFFRTELSANFRDVIEVSDGYLISGFIRLSYNPYGTSDDDAWLVKLDKNGNLLWQKLYGAPVFAEAFNNIFLSPDDGLIAAGDTETSGAGISDIFVMKLDANGDLPGCLFAGCSFVRPATANQADLLFQIVNTNLTISQATFVSKDAGLVAVDTNYSPGNLCIEGTMPIPVSQSSFSYPTDLTPSLNTDPGQATPLALGHIAESPFAPLSLRIGVLPFSGPMDAYLGIYAPTVSPEIWLVTPENTLQSFSQGLVKWKGGVTEKISESVVEFMDMSEYPSGDYHFFFGVVPAGSIDDSYLLETSFTDLQVVWEMIVKSLPDFYLWETSFTKP